MKGALSPSLPHAGMLQPSCSSWTILPGPRTRRRTYGSWSSRPDNWRISWRSWTTWQTRTRGRACRHCAMRCAGRHWVAGPGECMHKGVTRECVGNLEEVHTGGQFQRKTSVYVAPAMQMNVGEPPAGRAQRGAAHQAGPEEHGEQAHVGGAVCVNTSGRRG